MHRKNTGALITIKSYEQEQKEKPVKSLGTSLRSADSTAIRDYIKKSGNEIPNNIRTLRKNMNQIEKQIQEGANSKYKVNKITNALTLGYQSANAMDKYATNTKAGRNLDKEYRRNAGEYDKAVKQYAEKLINSGNEKLDKETREMFVRSLGQIIDEDSRKAEKTRNNSNKILRKVEKLEEKRVNSKDGYYGMESDKLERKQDKLLKSKKYDYNSLTKEDNETFANNMKKARETKKNRKI